MNSNDHPQLRAARALAAFAASTEPQERVGVHLGRLRVGAGCHGDMLSPLLRSDTPLTGTHIRHLTRLLDRPAPFTGGPTWGPQWASRAEFDAAVVEHRANAERDHVERLAREFAGVATLAVAHCPSGGPQGVVEVFAQHGCRCGHSSSTARTTPPDSELRSTPSTAFALPGGVLLFCGLDDPRPAIRFAIDAVFDRVARFTELDRARVELESVPPEVVAAMGYVEYEAHTAALAAERRARWGNPTPGWAELTKELDTHLGAHTISVEIPRDAAETILEFDGFDDGAPGGDDITEALRSVPR